MVSLDFVHGLANSSNVYFYKLGGGYEDEVPDGLGICRLGTYAAALGYGDAPGLGLPDEEDGLVPDPTWKRINQAESWSSGDTYIASVGQGYVLATPIQVLLSAATVANNGKLVQPTLLREVLDSEGNTVPMWRDAEGDLVDQPRSWQHPDLAVPAASQMGPDRRPGHPGIWRDHHPRLRADPGQKKTVQPWVFDTGASKACAWR